MPRLFGTDGIRGIANLDLTPDFTLALGRAAGTVLGSPGEVMVVGRDTRVSGPMLEGALIAGLCSAGIDVRVAGVLPSPAVSFLTIDEGATAGAMISASHNPVDDNGIKFFSSHGLKLTEEVEDEIEARMKDPSTDAPTGAQVGGSTTIAEAAARYESHLLSSLDGSLRGLKVVLDCAYGAAWEVGPRVLRAAGADVIALHDRPDGTKINVDCGSTAMGPISVAVRAERADMGLALDGDADRVLAVSENGEIIDGDRILATTALHLKESGDLDGGLVVATVMSNLGMTRALEQEGIEVVHAPVGDKYVVEMMQDRGAVLGGEQSGHIIFGRHSTTGDGLLTGLQLAAAVASSGRRLGDLTRVFDPYPQVLVNVRVRSTGELDSNEAVWRETAAIERTLGDEGRVLLRASGTEPVVRVMVEASDEKVARDSADRLAAAVRHHLS